MTDWNRTPNTTCDYCEKRIYKRPKEKLYRKFCSRLCRDTFRFYDKIDKINGLNHPVHGKCWEWIGHAHGNNGYGGISDGGKIVYVHRFSYKFFVGEIPGKLKVLHKCDNRKCVNPNHLFLGTLLDNSQDMVRKGRHSTKNYKRKGQKLSIDDVRIIKKRIKDGDKSKIIARDYGVTDRHMFDIKKGYKWSWV